MERLAAETNRSTRVPMLTGAVIRELRDIRATVERLVAARAAEACDASLITKLRSIDTQLQHARAQGDRLGLALGLPVVGFVIDRTLAPWGFVAAGGGDLAVAATAYLLGRMSPRRWAPSSRPLQPRSGAGTDTDH